MISVIRKKGINPMTGETLYRIQWTREATVDEKKMAKTMARGGTYSVGEASGVLLDFPQYFVDELLNGNAVSTGSNLNENDEVAISITPAEGQTPTATLNGSEIELTESDGVYTGNFAMPAQAATLVINTGSSGGGGGFDNLDQD